MVTSVVIIVVIVISIVTGIGIVIAIVIIIAIDIVIVIVIVIVIATTSITFLAQIFPHSTKVEAPLTLENAETKDINGGEREVVQHDTVDGDIGELASGFECGASLVDVDGGEAKTEDIELSKLQLLICVIGYWQTRCC